MYSTSIPFTSAQLSALAPFLDIIAKAVLQSGLYSPPEYTPSPRCTSRPNFTPLEKLVAFSLQSPLVMYFSFPFTSAQLTSSLLHSFPRCYPPRCTHLPAVYATRIYAESPMCLPSQLCSRQNVSHLAPRPTREVVLTHIPLNSPLPFIFAPYSVVKNTTHPIYHLVLPSLINSTF